MSFPREQLRTWLAVRLRERCWDPKVRTTVAIRSQGLHHRVPRVITRASRVASSMIHKPRLRRIRALEEPITGRAVVPISTGEHTPIVLAPRAGEVRRRGAVPREQADAVVGRPAVRRGVGDVGLAVEVERRGGLVHGGAVALEGEGGLGDDVDGPREGGVAVRELLDADGLVGHAVEAREHKPVAVAVEAEHRAVDGPLVCQLSGVAVSVPRCGAACSVIRSFLITTLGRYVRE